MYLWVSSEEPPGFGLCRDDRLHSAATRCAQRTVGRPEATSSRAGCRPRAPPAPASFHRQKKGPEPVSGTEPAQRRSDHFANDRDDDASKHMSPSQPCRRGHVMRPVSASTSLPRRAPAEVLAGVLPPPAVRGTDMLAAHIAAHGLESVQALIVAISVLIVIFWRIVLKMLLIVSLIVMLLLTTSGAAVLLQHLHHLIK